MIRLCVVAAMLFLVSGCNNTAEVEMSPKVKVAIEQALKDKDYRLYVTSGRRVTIPGIENPDVDKLKNSCGFRYMDGVSDVLRHPEEMEKRKESLTFMAEYNRLVLKYCT